MTYSWRHSRLLAVCIASSGLWCNAAFTDDRETALDRYVATPDASYSWKVVAKHAGTGCTIHVLAMTSQTWRAASEIDRTTWQHWLVVVVPEERRGTTGMLLIGGGRNGGEPPKGTDPTLVDLAVKSRSVVAELRMVPNQPLVLGGDGKPRVEDDFIAYTWDKFMRTGDETWPARLPMVKSAVRALDTLQAFSDHESEGKHKLERFVVAGASKRGWTTWCTAAVDKRVTAIVPIVIDVLNVRISMKHHRAAYGFWAPAVGDYVEHKITEREDTAEYSRLLEIEDPYSYRTRFTMPKFIINATGDQYFLPDSSRFYFGDLPGEKHLRYVPNADHSLRGSDARDNLAAFYELVLNGKPRPRFDWAMKPDGAIEIRTVSKPQRVMLWQATNPKARDFRLQTIGPAFSGTDLRELEAGVYRARVDPPKDGWTAFFAELTFDTGDRLPYKATTAVRVTPDVLPFGGEVERGKLKGES